MIDSKFSENGYINIGGLLIQWGKFNPTDEWKDISFNTAFKYTPYVIIPIICRTASENRFLASYNCIYLGGTTNKKFRYYTATKGSDGYEARYIAIGI